MLIDVASTLLLMNELARQGQKAGLTCKGKSHLIRDVEACHQFRRNVWSVFFRHLHQDHLLDASTS